MPIFPREKYKLDLLGLATRKERNPWLERFYLVVAVAFFGYLLYRNFVAD